MRTCLTPTLVGIWCLICASDLRSETRKDGLLCMMPSEKTWAFQGYKVPFLVPPGHAQTGLKVVNQCCLTRTRSVPILTHTLAPIVFSSAVH